MLAVKPNVPPSVAVPVMFNRWNVVGDATIFKVPVLDCTKLLMGVLPDPVKLTMDAALVRSKIPLLVKPDVVAIEPEVPKANVEPVLIWL